MGAFYLVGERDSIATERDKYVTIAYAYAGR
jgi:hypothetical protein